MPNRARFLPSQCNAQGIRDRAAVLFLNGDAEQAEGTQLGPEIARKLIALVDFFGARRDLVGREIANSVAEWHPPSRRDQN
jgi:hypothetical protein